MRNIHKFLLAAVLLPATSMADIDWYLGLGPGGTRVEQDINVAVNAFEWDDNNGVYVPLIDQSGSSDPTNGAYNPRKGSPVAVVLDKFRGTDIGFRTFGGVRFGQYFGIELGYVNLGEPEDEVAISVPSSSGPSPTSLLCNRCRAPIDAELVLTDELDGFDIYAVGAYPFAERWEAFGKIGLIAWDSTFTFRNIYAETFPPTQTGNPVRPRFEPSDRSTVRDDGTDLAAGFGVNYRATDHMILRGEGTWYDIDNVEQAWLLGFNVIIAY